VLLAQACAPGTTVSPSTVPDQEGYDTYNQPAVGGVFSERTGTFLLFDDGIDGVLGVDLDNRVAARRES
jgi:hypothetical protein